MKTMKEKLEQSIPCWMPSGHVAVRILLWQIAQAELAFLDKWLREFNQ